MESCWCYETKFEFRSLMAWGKKLILSLSVFAIMLWKHLPDGSKMETVVRVIWVLDDFISSAFAAFEVDVLQRGEEAHNSLQGFAVLIGDVSITHWDSMSQYIFYGPWIESFQDCWWAPEFSQLSQMVQSLPGFLNLSLNVCSPSQVLGDVYTEVLEATNKQIQIQIKLGWALFVTYTIIQSIMRSEMCSLHLTHPSVHTWSSGQPTVQRPGSSRGLPAGVGIRTHNLGLPRVSSRTLYPLGQRLPNDCPAAHPLHRGPTDHKRSVGPLRSLTEVHNQLFNFAHVQRETVVLAPWCKSLYLIQVCGLIVFGNEAQNYSIH